RSAPSANSLPLSVETDVTMFPPPDRLEPSGCARPRSASQVAARFLQSFEGADLVEALFDLVRGQLVLRHQPLIHARQIVALVGRNGVEGGAAKGAEAVVDVAHRGRLIPFVVGEDASVSKLHVASVPTIVVSKDRHPPELRRPVKRRRDRTVVTGQIAIAVQDEERLPQQRKRPLDGPARPEQSRTVEGKLDLEPEPVPVRQVRADHVPEISAADDDALEAVGAQQAELMGNERLAVHIDEGLGNVLRQRPQPGGHTTGQQRERHHRSPQLLSPGGLMIAPPPWSLRSRTGSALPAARPLARRGARGPCRPRKTSGIRPHRHRRPCRPELRWPSRARTIVPCRRYSSSPSAASCTPTARSSAWRNRRGGRLRGPPCSSDPGPSRNGGWRSSRHRMPDSSRPARAGCPQPCERIR